jgi:hypothetical protein
MDSALVNRRGIPFEYDHAERDYYEETIEELAMQVKHHLLYKDLSNDWRTFKNSLMSIIRHNIFAKDEDGGIHITPAGHHCVGGGMVSTSLVVRWSAHWQPTIAGSDNEKVEYAVINDTRDYFLKNINNFSNSDEMAELIRLMG